MCGGRTGNRPGIRSLLSKPASKVDLRVKDPTPRACDSLPLTTHFDHFPCIDHHVLYANNSHHALFRHILQNGDRSICLVPLIDRDSILEQRLFGNIHFILYFY